MDQFDVPLINGSKLADFLSGDLLEARPEELVRQRYLRILHFEYQYPKDVLAREVPIIYGSRELVDRLGDPVRADIVIYSSARACAARNQGKISLIVECKQPNEEGGYNQLVSYIYNTSAEGGVWFNGDLIAYFRRLVTPSNSLVPWTGLPRRGEAWDALGRRKKADLRRPKDIRGLLRRCHNKLHGRGVDGEEEDLTMDMVRLILAKAMDEERTGDLPDFYCTPEEYSSTTGQAAVAQRIQALFREVARMNSDVFGPAEEISVGARAICDVVVELQAYRLLSDLNQSEDWDIMGYAYEQYTAMYLKRSKGQFFTNRLVVDLMVALADPGYQDIILDPAGGSGGFLTGAMRYVRHKILGSSGSAISKQRQLDRHRTRLFMVEISKRLVKIAKTAMILNGDGHTGMTQGDSLGAFASLSETVLAQCGKGKPTVILTNPPFAGVGEGRVTDEAVLAEYATGHRWVMNEGTFTRTKELLTDGVPPEMLFFERCIQWLAPGGRLAIVMPKGFLDTQTYRPARELLLRDCRLLGVINAHKNTFQPHTGVRTCVVVLEKFKAAHEQERDYPIFMAICKKIGQDSEGAPIFQRDETGMYTDSLDHDLDDILRDYRAFESGQLKPSEYRFSVMRSELDATLRLNPQAYLPDYNDALKRLEAIDQTPGWSVAPLSQLDPRIRIFKGPRFKSENILVEEILSSQCEPYYTPSAVLQEKSDSVKFVDVSRATASQLRAINAIRVQRGDIVVTRSGSIGRIAYITQRFNGAIVSDDLIRVRIADERLRLYVFAFLQTDSAQKQMLRNEYGSVQQHLEPGHVANLLIPVPDDPAEIADIVATSKKLVALKEALDLQTLSCAAEVDGLLEKLMAAAGS